ncbi:MAG: thiamine pyrophosphate-dependent dehydrogenase E1 component subunit alpha [Chloroflexi bacterium]|nr:MAG: thiamine pyrophosphate-dependent dehydrogenase E1 component subunit alpha [Chloroflexota bacterium]
MKPVPVHPRAAATESPSPEVLRSMYVAMQRIRRFEEAIAESSSAREFKGPTHLYIGQEAVAAGVCTALEKGDYVFGGHRSHGHYLAKGGSMRGLAAEIFVRETGCSKGRGGSMHLTAPEIGLLGTSALVGGGMGPGVGTALASVLLGRDHVTAIFFGDGAIEEGIFSESLNFASLKKLPVIFICENNLYASHLPLGVRQPQPELFKHAEPYGLPGLRIDGNDAVEVYRTAASAVERARAGEGPTMLECMTYRWRGHVGPSYDLEYDIRTREELDSWIARDPIERLAGRMAETGVMTEAERARIDTQVQDDVDDSMSFARKSPFPEVKDLLKYVYKD